MSSYYIYNNHTTAGIESFSHSNYTTATTESYSHNINMTASASSNDVSNSYPTAAKEYLGSMNNVTGDKGELYSIIFRDSYDLISDDGKMYYLCYLNIYILIIYQY